MKPEKKNMKFEIAKEKLSNYLQQLSSVIEKNSAQPILSHIYIEATEDGKLQLTATDTEITLSALVSATVFEAGKITVAAERFIPLIKSLNENSKVYCEVIDGQFFVHTEGGKMKLATLPAEDFPLPEGEEEKDFFAIDALRFSDILSRVRTAVAVNDSRHYLNGVFIKKTDNSQEIEAVATDGKRLAVAKTQILNESGEEKSFIPFILPIKAVSTLINLLSVDIAISELKALKEGLNGEELEQVNQKLEELQKIKKSGGADENAAREVVLHLGERKLRVEIGAYHFSTLLIDGNYPDYLQMIPERKEYPVQVSREDFQNVLRRIQVLFQKSRDKFVSMRFEYENMFLAARNELDESLEQRLALIDPQSEIPQIAVNVDYILGCSAQFNEAILQLHIFDASSPMMLTSANNPNLCFVIMPMRV